MGVKDDEFLKRLLAAFRVEAEEHIRAIANGLLELEKRQTPEESAQLVETMYREAHSLKGAARAVNMHDIETVCQAIESVFSAIKSHRIAACTEMFDILHRAADVMGELLSGSQVAPIQPLIEELTLIAASGKVSVSRSTEAARAKPEPIPPEPGPAKPAPPGVEALERVSVTPASAKMEEPRTPDREEPIEIAVEEASVRAVPPLNGAEHSNAGLRKERGIQTETVRIAVDKLDRLLRQVSEMVTVKLTTDQRMTDLSAAVKNIEAWGQKWAAFSSHDKALGALLAKAQKFGDNAKDEGNFAKLVEFLEWNEQFVHSLENKLKALAKSAETDGRLRAGMVDELLQDMMSVLMLPCSSLLEFFPKLVRDLARDDGKEVELVVRGGDLEIDRRILDEMKDPLIHLVRNCIDHGIEKPDERLRKHKPRKGTLTMAISQVSGNQIELVVSDDGAGIDVEKVREAASRRGMLSEQERLRLEGNDALSLVFRSDVSTSPIVSNLSGRGLGLAIVREKVENLGGNISLGTEVEMGTSFRILLPVTLSTFRGVLVHCSEQLFVIPTTNVERVSRIKKDVIKTVGNRETIEVKGQAMPLVRLHEILGLASPDRKGPETEFIPVLILCAAEKRIAFHVDKVLQEQEVLVKPLGKQLVRVRNVAGATVLGSGKLAPILNVSDLIKSATRHTFAMASSTARLEEADNGHKSILVVEDSITSRMLLKNILESAGYLVTTSVDGAEAWGVLKSGQFDLVVSDIEMPRMNGFDLTASIRNDADLSHMPVVLVTSLGSREDRERGIEVGANAYITKGSFDQNNLLEVIERLV